MLGAIFGDIIGSTRELHNVKTEEFELFPPGSHFTDDTVMTVAVAEKLLNYHSGCTVGKRMPHAISSIITAIVTQDSDRCFQSGRKAIHSEFKEATETERR